MGNIFHVAALCALARYWRLYWQGSSGKRRGCGTDSRDRTAVMIAHNIDASYSQPAQQAVYAQVAAPCRGGAGTGDAVSARCAGVMVPAGLDAVHPLPLAHASVPSYVQALATVSEAPERPWFMAMLLGLALTLSLRGLIFFSGSPRAALGRSGA